MFGFPSRSWMAAFLAGAAATLSAGTSVKTDVPYLEEGRAETMDLYLPEGPGPHPAALLIHGGGWVKGTKAGDREKEIGTTFASAGYVCASIAYKLGPKSWPTNLLDAKNGVRYLRAHASALGVDPSKIAVIGCSAGAHLALMVGYTEADPALSPSAPFPGVSDAVAAVVEMYGPTDLLTRRDVTADGFPLPSFRDAYAPIVLGATRVQDPALWKNVSPVSHIHAGGPPVLILHGLADPIMDVGQAVELDQVLEKAGIDHQMVLLPKVGHEFDFERWQGKPLPMPLAPIVLAFLEKHGVSARSPSLP